MLTLEPLNARASSGGSLEGLVRVDSSGDTTTLLADIDIGRVAMPRLGGTLDVEVRVNGSGNSVAALMGGLNGQVLLRAMDGRIERSFLTGLGTGLLDSINPLAKDEEFTTLECLVARLDVVDGKIELQDKIAAQTDKVTWFVAGDIDLKTEKIDIGASPKPRKGVGLSAGGLAKLVHVGGTLKKPRVRLDPKDVAKKYAGYLAAVQTGGLSLLVQGFLDKRKANVDVCQEVLKGTQFD